VAYEFRFLNDPLVNLLSENTSYRRNAPCSSALARLILPLLSSIAYPSAVTGRVLILLPSTFRPPVLIERAPKSAVEPSALFRLIDAVAVNFVGLAMAGVEGVMDFLRRPQCI
jgi:hypothetical protein